MSAATRQVSRSIIYGGSALSRENQLRRLASGNRTKFEQMAMFLSAIDLSNFAENNNSQKIAKLSGTVRGSDNKRRAGVKVIVAGVETVTNDRSEEHTSELQSLMRISYAVFCLKKKNKNTSKIHNSTII